MNIPPENLGNYWLVAMEDAPESLDMVRIVANILDHPEITRITLMHYLAPIYWEHGGFDTPEGREVLRREEQQIDREERSEEYKTFMYFERASQALQDTGVPVNHIHISTHFDEQDVTDAILNELKSGIYSAVIVGRSHHDILAGILGTSVAESLRQHARDVVVWVVEDEAQSQS